MDERLIIVGTVIILFSLAMKLFGRHQLKQANAAASEQDAAHADAGRPRIVYFWSTNCGQCKAVQTPILDKLPALLGEQAVKIDKIDISESTEKAELWGVRTVPTIFVLDASGKVVHINNGVITEQKLLSQLGDILPVQQ